MSTGKPDMLAAALEYRRERHAYPIPLCWPDERGECGCGRGHQGKEIGKAPLLGEGYEKLKPSVDQVRGWWRTWPEANVGLLLEPSGLVVTDLDGEEAIEEARAYHLPLGPVARSGREDGGEHRYSRRPEGCPAARACSKGACGKIDVLGKGYVIAPPSLHRSGRRYEWLISPEDAETPDAPAWCVDLLKKVHQGKPVSVPNLPADLPRVDVDRLPVSDRTRKLIREGKGADPERWKERSGPQFAALLAMVTAGLDDATIAGVCFDPKNKVGEKAREKGRAWFAVDLARAREKHQEPEAPPPYGDEDAPPRTSAAEVPPPPPAEIPRPAIISARDLMAMTFDRPRCPVPGIVAEGVNVLAARPKIGKSWLMLQVALAVASGGRALGKIPVQQGSALYLGLEDKPQRLQGRLLMQLQGAEAPEALCFTTDWQPLDRGGLDMLAAWLKEAANPRLVVVDTLARIRPARRGNGDVYAEDYAVMTSLKRLADEHRIGLVLVHHVRKGDTADPLEAVSGTFGLTGAADSVLALKRARGEADGTLFICGRDLDEQELALKFDTSTGCWGIIGDADEFRMSEQRKAILRELREGPKRVAEVARGMGRSYNTVKQLMWKMEDDGQLVNFSGLYGIPTTGNRGNLDDRDNPGNCGKPDNR